MKISQARPDGRPQYYDISPQDRVQCALCLQRGITAQYGRGEGFMADPGNSPFNDGGVYTICKGDIPETAVLYDPLTNQCRTKDGQNTWVEADATEGVMPPKLED